MTTRTLVDELDKKLNDLVQEVRQFPAGSPRRQRGLTQMIRLIKQSNRLWHENSDYYEDALQQTWLFFCRNVCEGKSGEAYNCDRGSIITWLNHYLKWRLHDFREEANTRRKLMIQDNCHRETYSPSVVESLPAPDDIPPILEQTRVWATQDLEGCLRQVHIQGNPNVSCQTLILRRLPPETSWQDLSKEYDLPISTLSSFYQRQCIPRLRKFGVTEGYINRPGG